MKDWLRAKLRRWLGIEEHSGAIAGLVDQFEVVDKAQEDSESNINALAVSLKMLIERVDTCESGVILSADLKALQERVTMLETAAKSAPIPEEKKQPIRNGGWKSLKANLQKDSEWPH